MAKGDDDVRAVFDEVNELLQEDDQGNRKHKGSPASIGETVRTGGLEDTMRFEVCDSDSEYYSSNELFTEFDSEEKSSKNLARPMELSIVMLVENKDSWQWFLENMKEDLDMYNSHQWAFISDRQKA
ncbi:hypothetical protein GH714_011036 [Hevea brasiliensis]|uniref:MULE transposase domain-containing protein n=1 Tax=Hevea brasiliensis TaxID=3981 RepID=A0A6A6LA20_HEVBR|nr:hypothetical protein GH714_011036 [Hevea brasiliensis]